MSAAPVNFRVHIHLGTHKTATTFIQNWLSQHQALLMANQIATIPLNMLRGQFTPTFWGFVYGQAAWSPALAQQLRAIIDANIVAAGFDLQATRLLILSDENLLGSLSTLTNKGLLYPDLATRMARLAAVFEGCVIQPFLALRSYSEFYPSAYAETLRAGHIKPFAEYMDGLDLTGNSWLGVVDAVESVFGSVALWPYELFRDNATTVLSALLQTPVAAELMEKSPIARRSLTLKGLDIVMRCQGTLSALEMKKLVHLLAERMVFDSPDGRITIDDPAINDRLDAQYQRELDCLADRFIIGRTYPA
jgi:hypothetical protein